MPAELQLVQPMNKASQVLKSIAHPIRLSILELLRKNQTMTVTEIYQALHMEQSLVSHHLSKLKDTDVIASRRDGQNVYYYIREQDVLKVIDCVLSFSTRNN